MNLDLDLIIEQTEDEMKKTVTAWTAYMNKIRTGRANASMLERVMVNYYGTPTPLLQTAQVTIPEPNLIVIRPYDRHQVSEIVGGIHKADLGFNPMADAEVVRIVLPPLTEEIRRDVVKKMWKELETFKVRIRNERREAMDQIKKIAEISEDLVKSSEKDIQDLTNKYVKILDDAAKNKEQEILKL